MPSILLTHIVSYPHFDTAVFRCLRWRAVLNVDVHLPLTPLPVCLLRTAQLRRPVSPGGQADEEPIGMCVIMALRLLHYTAVLKTSRLG